MPTRQTRHAHRTSELPLVWLLSDARNDAGLDDALRALPRGSGFVFRHYHLGTEERRRRFDALANICRNFGHLLALSDAPSRARQWGADAVYGPPGSFGDADGLLRLATAHGAEEVGQAAAAGADAIFLSPVFPTRSHQGAACLGRKRFLELAALAPVPVIALGGMDAARANELGWPRWGAVDGLVFTPGA